MPPFYRIAEICCYAILNFLPYLAAALYPFRHKLRFSKPIMLMFVLLITLFQIALGLCSAFLPHVNRMLINTSSTLIYFLFYFWAVRAHFGKTLFTLLMLSNIANFVVVSSKCLEGYLFPALARQPYRWSYSLVMAAVQIAILIPLFVYIRRIYAHAIEKETNPAAWRYLWLIPATFYLLWSYHLFGNEKSGTEMALQPEHTIFLWFINLGAFLIYYMVVCLINEHDHNHTLETQNHLLYLQAVQYEHLKNRIAETQRARHDLRHHTAVMAGFLDAGELDKLAAYLDSYRKSLPADGSIQYCKNSVINLLLLYFAQQAREREIAFDVHMDIPADLNIAENDLSVVLGNLLENALEACTQQTRGLRRITICGKANGSTLLLTIDNTYEQEILRDANGAYLSTKHKGVGLGLESVRQIALRYDGVFQAEQKDGVFFASVLLNYERIC